MTYRIKGFGWLPDPPDVRDYRLEDQEVAKSVESNVKAMAERASTDVFQSRVRRAPGTVDLRHLCSPIEDQGELGSCTAQAVCGLVEYLQRSLEGQHIDASPLFLYKVTRAFLGWTGDTGAFVRSTIKALRLFGVSPEDYYPYDIERFDDDPGGFVYAFAGNYKAIQYHRLDTLDELKRSLAQGIPFAFGFTCYRSMFTDEVSSSGDIPMPSSNDQDVGGHAVVGVGYDDSKGTVLIRNSWGTRWGDAGYGTLPYEYVQRGIARDFWALTEQQVVPIEGFR